MITFSTAKNGEKTCEIAGKHLHSAYNPSREAEQFVSRLEASFDPSAVIIIEPVLSHCLPFLKKRFPKATLCAVRLSDDFSAYDGGWHCCLKADESLADSLYDSLGEEKLCAALFYAWPASEQAFAAEARAAWEAIRSAVLKSRDVLATRSFFARRWMKNAVVFCRQIRHPARIAHGSCGILIAASGTSLKTSLPKIREYRDRFFLIAVSSALLPLSSHGIMPDLVISTDGGYWAKKHLAQCGEDFSAIPFAVSAEGACPAAVLEHNPIVPLRYDDGAETKLLNACGIDSMPAKRNGTVSGTAAEFALALTSGNIYFCGLDLATAKGFQHTQPNALERLHEAKDNRLRTKDTRIAASEFGAHGALDLYRNWFVAESPRLSKRLFRLSDNFAFRGRLGQIEDINWNDFLAREPAQKAEKPAIVVAQERNMDCAPILEKALHELLDSADFARELCPVEVMLKKRALSEEEKASCDAAITKKMEAFKKELRGMLHG